MVAIAARGDRRTFVLRPLPANCVTVGVENPSTVEMVARVDNSNSSAANVIAAGRRRLRREEDFIMIMLTTQKSKISLKKFEKIDGVKNNGGPSSFFISRHKI